MHSSVLLRKFILYILNLPVIFTIVYSCFITSPNAKKYANGLYLIPTMCLLAGIFLLMTKKVPSQLYEPVEGKPDISTHLIRGQYGFWIISSLCCCGLTYLTMPLLTTEYPSWLPPAIYDILTASHIRTLLGINLDILIIDGTLVILVLLVTGIVKNFLFFTISLIIFLTLSLLKFLQCL